MDQDKIAELNKIAKQMVAPGKGILAADESMKSIEKKFTKNNYLAGYKKDLTQNLISIYQNWITYGLIPSMVATDYRTRTQSTRVLIKEGSITITDSWLPGVRLLSIYTKNGNLEYKY